MEGTGRLSVIPPSEFPWKTPSAAAAYTVCEWLPPEALLCQLPSGLRWPFVLYQREDGRRIVFPPVDLSSEQGVMDFVSRAFIGGFALRAHRDPGLRASFKWHGFLFWMFQRVRRSREHCDYEFLFESDLVAKSQAALATGVVDKPAPGHAAHIIPPVFGNQTVSGIMTAGCNAALRAGHDQPTTAQKVQYGLIEVARSGSMDTNVMAKVEAIGPRRLVLESLYAADIDDDTLRDAENHAITRRLLDWVVKRLDLDTPQLMRLLTAPGSSIVGAVTRPKRGGGPYEISAGRRVLLALGWRSYEHVGRCVDAFMANVKELITPPLNREESTLFDEHYLRRPHFGDMPFVLLRERSYFLEPILDDLRNRGPEPDVVQLLHTALYLYGQMARLRRCVDRLRHQPATIQTPEEMPTDEFVSETVGDPGQTEDLPEVIELLRERVVKPCACVRASLSLADSKELQDGGLRLNWICSACEQVAEQYVSRDERSALRKRGCADG